ncbi:MAG: M20 family metallo-hydrolase [Firmicutes bacterium]|nr:M20 family metallo-hydrolase [Bacillota bacterium]
MQASVDRIRRDIDRINQYTGPGLGINRLSFTPEHQGAVDYVRKQLEAIDYEMRVTAHGNYRFRRKGDDWSQPAVTSGSHLDAVPEGGRFDGVAGVVAAVEVARLLAESGDKPSVPYEIIVFSEEEGSRFGGVLTGSKAMIGSLTKKDLVQMQDQTGISYIEAIENIGVNTSDWDKAVIHPGDINAYFELHIEQSLVLETKGIPVGIVTDITGIRIYRITYQGVPNHAGATPMPLREDSLAAAAEAIQAIESLAQGASGGTMVGTVGIIENEPNVSNVIPGRTHFSLDLRDIDRECLVNMSETIISQVKDIATRRGINCTIKMTADAPPVSLSNRARQALLDATKELGIKALEMPSGAGHDAQEMARVTDVGMIFVPSIGGRSHCPEEESRFTDIAHGTSVLYSAIRKLCL